VCLLRLEVWQVYSIPFLRFYPLQFSSFLSNPFLFHFQNTDQLPFQANEDFRSGFIDRQVCMVPNVSLSAAARIDKYSKYTLNGVGNFDTNLSTDISKDQRIPDPSAQSATHIRVTRKRSKCVSTANGLFLRDMLAGTVQLYQTLGDGWAVST
jgi:hypothetical protein